VDLLEPLARTLRPGDAVMVKGSNGSRMGRIVEALKARYAVDEARRALATAP
jgi:UDP-N-acetylmuramoyl-tripeptide--D-alanyl-D-alanine ligase